MEAAAVLQELPPDRGAHELFGYVGIEAVLEQMKVKTMKMGFEFNIMVVGERLGGGVGCWESDATVWGESWGTRALGRLEEQ